MSIKTKDNLVDIFLLLEECRFDVIRICLAQNEPKTLLLAHVFAVFRLLLVDFLV